MVRFLIERPIAVIMSFVALIIFSMITLRQLPISLLPDVDVPNIMIKFSYPNGSPAQIEQNILKPIRSSMVTIDGLNDIESMGSNEAGKLILTFDYGIDMSLAYIEVNEKLDRLTNQLPHDLNRPTVAKVNTSDIPIIRIQVVPNEGTDFLKVSELTEKVIKKRLEQLEGVSLVDINGLRKGTISISPDYQAMEALGINDETLFQTIQNNNQNLGAIQVKDGHYEYYLKLSSKLSTEKDLLDIPVRTDKGIYVELKDIARIDRREEKPTGFHLFGEQEALVITVHKQSKAKMTDLIPVITESVDNFRKDYQQVDFKLTQDQSLLLNAGINNLQSSLLLGGFFAFIVLFLFTGNYRIPIIMGISLPVSVAITFLIFYLFQLSINIISLSGLALGLGLLIDNAIIVIDNISRHRRAGLPLKESCIKGVNEVMSALISAVLTTLAVFIPLVFLNGLSGALFFDQALAVTAILFVSLLVSFILLPLIYRLLFNKKQGASAEDSVFFKKILSIYKFAFDIVFKRKWASFLFIIAFIAVSLVLGYSISKEGLPPVDKNDSVIKISWNEPIGINENKKRVIEMVRHFAEGFNFAESDIGVKQFLLENEKSGIQQADIYLHFNNKEQKETILPEIEKYFYTQFPSSRWTIEDAPNAFDQLFKQKNAYFKIKWRALKKEEPLPPTILLPLLDSMNILFGENSFRAGPGIEIEDAISITIDNKKLSFYDIDYNSFQLKLSKVFGAYQITELKNFGESTPVMLYVTTEDLDQKINATSIASKNGSSYPMSRFLDYNFVRTYKHISSDKTGIYQDMFTNVRSEYESIKEKVKKIGLTRGLQVEFEGLYFDNKEDLKQLLAILLISVLLLYFILAAQFESFVQPLIVIFTLPLAIGGSIIVLIITGSTLNVMSAIGIIVMLGIVVNDAILKIDTINRLKKEAFEKMDVPGGSFAKQKLPMLEQAISKSGEIRLKPILMTSITTVLALLPIVFSSGIGADLQRSLVYAVIGGLTIGTGIALYFIPLAYWAIYRNR